MVWLREGEQNLKICLFAMTEFTNVTDRQTDRQVTGWLRGTVAERRSLTGELSLSCARPVADG